MVQIKRKKVTLNWIWVQSFSSSETAFIRFTAEDKVIHEGTFLFSNRNFFYNTELHVEKFTISQLAMW